MTKNKSLLFLIIASLTSCNYISYSQLVPMIRTATFGVPDIIIDDVYISAKEYSFAKVKIGRSGIAIMTLSGIEDDIFTWISSSGEKLQTVNGKIIKISGSSFDFELFGFNKFSLEPSSSQTISDGQLMLQSPRAFVELTSTITQLPNSNDSYLFEELVSTSSFKWSFVNSYWVDPESSLAIKSIQRVHPQQATIEISYYYK